MTPPLTVFLTLYASLLACWALVTATLARRPGPGLLGGLVLLELTLVVQAALVTVEMLGDGGPRPAEPATHSAYLAASVLLLPLLLGLTRSPGAVRSRWDAAVAALACISLVVVELRLVATGAAA